MAKIEIKVDLHPSYMGGGWLDLNQAVTGFADIVRARWTMETQPFIQAGHSVYIEIDASPKADMGGKTTVVVRDLGDQTDLEAEVRKALTDPKALYNHFCEFS